MGDYIYASFRVGGKVPRNHARRLIQIAEAYGLSVDGGGGNLDPDDLTLVGEEWSDSQISSGDLDNLESFCINRGIDYDKYHEAGPGWDAEQAKMRGGVLTTFATGENGAVVPVADLVKLDALATGWAELHDRIRRWAIPLAPVELVADQLDDAEDEDV